jgi:peptide/nickel transport system substrate-binding protein
VRTSVRNVVLVGALLTAAACAPSASPSPSGGATAGTSSPVTSTGASAAPSGAATACKATGGTLVYAFEEEPASLYELAPNSTGGTTRAVIIMWPRLVGIDLDFKPKPQLAETWEVSPDGLTYTFHLNPRAVWSDGQPITAADVQFTFDLLTKLNPSGLMTRFESGKASDEHTFVMKLKNPFAPLITSLANENDYWSIYPKHVYDGKDPKDWNGIDPVGGGTFLFKEWVRGDHIELQRNPNYFIAGRPCLDTVILKFAPDAASRKIAFERGDIDFLSSYLIPFESLGSYRDNPKFKVVDGGLGVATSDFLVFNTQNQYLKNKSVRQAIAYALDRDDYLQKANFGAGKVAHSPINSTLAAFFTAEYDVYTKNVDKANQLLDGASLPKDSSGIRFNLKLRVRPDRPFEGRGADIIKSSLSAVGINVTLQPGDAAAVYDAVYNKFDFDMAIQLRTTGPDPATNMPGMFGKVGVGQIAGNGGRYSNQALEDLFTNDAQVADPSQRPAIWKQAQQILMDDLPWLPLFEFPNMQLTSSRVADTVTGALDYQGNFVDAYQVGP